MIGRSQRMACEATYRDRPAGAISEVRRRRAQLRGRSGPSHGRAVELPWADDPGHRPERGVHDLHRTGNVAGNLAGNLAGRVAERRLLAPELVDPLPGPRQHDAHVAAMTVPPASLQRDQNPRREEPPARVV